MKKIAHWVKCKICEERFDRDKEKTVKIGGNRYAHALCAIGHETLIQNEKDKEELHTYLKELFKDQYDFFPLEQQIEAYVTKPEYKFEGKQFTYSGILKSLIYFYEIEGNTVDKSFGRIGIVPFVYKKAYDYYLELYLNRLVNAKENLDKYKNPPVKTIHIKRPVRPEPTFKLFNLDD